MQSKTVRIALQDMVSEDDISNIAWDKDWVTLKMISFDGINPKETIFGADKVQIHYIEDFKLGLNYLVVVGENSGSIVEEIRDYLPTYNLIDVFNMLENSESSDDCICAIYYLALISPEQFDLKIFNLLKAKLFDPNPEVRGSTILAISYIGWLEFLPLAKQIAIDEEDEGVRQDAQVLSENMEKLIALDNKNFDG